MTIEQQKAIALANARLRLQAKPPEPPIMEVGGGGRGGSALKPRYDPSRGVQPKVPIGEELSDLWKSAAIGVPQIATDLAGLPRVIQDVGAYGLDKLGKGVAAISPEPPKPGERSMWTGGVMPKPGEMATPESFPSSDDIQGTIEKATGEWYKPKHMLGRLGNNVVRQVGGAMVAGPETIAKNLAPKALSGVGAGLVSQGLSETSEIGKDPMMQIAGSVLGSLLGHRVGTSPSRYSPKTIAAQSVTDTLEKSGTTPAEVAQRMRDAQGAGVGGFNVADAIGPRGQRLMESSAAGAEPGVQRAARRAAENKISGASGRVQGVLEELAGGRDTPNRLRAQAVKARSAEADLAYDELRANAGPVDPTSTIKHLDDTINPQNAKKPNSIDQELQGFRDKLISETEKKTKSGTMKVTSVTDDWGKAEAVRRDIKDAIDTAHRQGDNARVRAFSKLRDELDKNLESASPGYSKAKDEFAERSNVLNQYETGKKMSGPNTRTEDIVNHVMGLTPEQKAAFRAGYYDRPIRSAQGWDGHTSPRIDAGRLGETAGVVGAPGARDLDTQLGFESDLRDSQQKLNRAIARSEEPNAPAPSKMGLWDYLSSAGAGAAGMAAPFYYAAQHAGSSPGAFAALVGAPIAGVAAKKLSTFQKAKAMPKIMEMLSNADPAQADKMFRQIARRGYKEKGALTAARAGLLGVLAGAR